MCVLVFFSWKLESKSTALDSKGMQTAESYVRQELMEKNEATLAKRSLQECIKIFDWIGQGAPSLTDAEVISLVDAKRILAYQLEKVVQDEERGVKIR